MIDGDGEEDRGSNAQQRAMLINESAEQMDVFTNTARGGKMMARMARKQSEPHMVAVAFGIVAEGGGLVRRKLSKIAKVAALKRWNTSDDDAVSRVNAAVAVQRHYAPCSSPGSYR
jgi:hypothetical protein